MIIVLIHWKIRPDMEPEFQEFWGKEAKIDDRSGLVGEYLCSVETAQVFPFITWPLIPDSNCYTPFINVAIWKDDNAFEDQVGKYMKDNEPPKDFEFSRRERTVLRPINWRVGENKLPLTNSDGVE